MPLYALCWCTGSGVVGWKDVGISVSVEDQDDECRECGEKVVASGEVCGIASRVEDRLFRPSGNRGVFGLSGERLCDPTLERPENICCTPVFTLLTVDSGGCAVDLSGVGRLGVVCRVGAMANELFCFPRMLPQRSPNSRLCRRLSVFSITHALTGIRSSVFQHIV